MICSRYFESNRSATLSIGIGCLIFSCLILILSSYGVSQYSNYDLAETGDNVTTTASTSAMRTTTPTTTMTPTTTTSRVPNMNQPTTPTTTTTKTPLPTTAANGTTPPAATKPVVVEYEDNSSAPARTKRDDQNQASIEKTVGNGTTSNSTASETPEAEAKGNFSSFYTSGYFLVTFK